MKATPLLFLVLVFLLSTSLFFTTAHAQTQTYTIPTQQLPTSQLSSSSQGHYWFQVGAWATNSEGQYASNFGIAVTGASVEIQVRSPQVLTDPRAALAYWVGINLPNDAFIQAGYIIYRGSPSPSWFWEYFPPGTALEASVAFMGEVGTSVGSNGTWVQFAVASEGNTWSAFVNDEKVGSINLGVSDSGTEGPFAIAEVAGTTRTDNKLGPVEFRNLQYRDLTGWHKAPGGISTQTLGPGSAALPDNTAFPYSTYSAPGNDNDWLAGSNLPKMPNTPISCVIVYGCNGPKLWPWHYVNVSSELGNSTGTGWYIDGESMIPHTIDQRYFNPSERSAFAGWMINGQPSYATQNQFKFEVTSNLNLTAIYKHEFYVNLTSPLGQTTGSGWYDKGSQATIKITPSSYVESGFLGELGVRKDFAHWQGNYSGSDNPANILVDSPKNISAVWTENYGLLPLVVFSIVAITGVGASILVLRARRPRKRSAATSGSVRVSFVF